MAIKFELTAETRSDVGKGASRRLRRIANRVPAIVYGADQNAETISIVHDDFIHALENEAFYSHILTLNLGKKKEQVVLKDLHRHPWKKQLLHADFLRVKADEELHMSIPLHFIGEELAPGIKIGGGNATHNMTEIEIKCLPKDLPEYIDVDMSQLELNDSIHLSDLKLPVGVKLATAILDEDSDSQVAAIHTPRKAEEIEETAAPVAIETEITSEKVVPGEESKEPTKGKESTKGKEPAKGKESK